MTINSIRIDNLGLLLNWIEEIETGYEMIETHNYNLQYFSFKQAVSSQELDAICNHINPILRTMKYKMRICWVAGEIRPVVEPFLVATLDAFG